MRFQIFNLKNKKEKIKKTLHNLVNKRYLVKAKQCKTNFIKQKIFINIQITKMNKIKKNYKTVNKLNKKRVHTIIKISSITTLVRTKIHKNKYVNITNMKYHRIFTTIHI